MVRVQQGMSATGIWFFFFAVFSVCPLVRAQNQAVTFSATGDVPYGANEMPKFQQQISNHNRFSPSAFFVHLGDVFTSGACGDSSYALMANTLKSLAVPVYIIPGDNETIDCLSASQGLELWKKYFLNYEQNFCGATLTQRQSTRPENWAFVMNGVLFIGIHNVGGSSPYQQDADWTVQQLQTKGSQVRAAVVFSHADPERSTVFSTPFRAAAAAFGKPVLFLHGHGHLWSMGYPFPEKNILRVQVDNGAAEDPIEVTVTAAVTTNPDSMFVIKRRPWSNFVVYNMPPCVNAGPDQTIASSTVANLQGAATDDGEPNSKLTTTWSKVSGPGTVTFANDKALATTASFNVSGAYVLRLTADDGQLQKDDEVIVAVNSGSRALSVSTAGSGTVSLNPPGGFYKDGTAVTLTAQSATGFRFTGWSGDLTGSSNPVTIVMNGNKNVVATFTAVQRTLVVNTVGSGSVSLNPPGGVYNDGAVVTLTAQSGTGFRFAGWSGDLTGSNSSATITMNGNKNVIATFTAIPIVQRTLTVNTAGFGAVSLNPPGGVYNDGTVVTLTAQSATGFRFTGWSGDLIGSSNSTTIRMDANKTVTAAFNLLPAAIVHEETLTGSASNWATLTTSTSLTGVSGHLYLAAISMRPKVSVLSVSGLGLSWKLVKSKCAGRNTTGIEVWMAQGTPNMPQQGTVTAAFTNVPVTSVITVSRYSGVAASNPIGNTLTGNTRGMNASGACTGGVDSSLYSFNLATTMNGAIVYAAAALKARTHTPGAGYVERTEVRQASGVNTSGVAVIDKTAASASMITVNGAFDSVVDWAVAALEIKPQVVTQLTLNKVGSGSVTLNPPGTPVSSGGVYNQGTVVVVTAQNGAGFRFTGWSGDLIGSSNPAAITMNGNKNVTATFTAVQRTLTVNTVGLGNVSLNPAGGVYLDGTVVTLTETPATGFQFSGWSDALTGAANPATITMDADKNVTAKFTANPNINLAKNRPVTASSSYTGRPPGDAVDGSASTYWRSLNKLDWLRVDLGAAMMIGRVVVNWNQSYYAKSYEVQVSNDAVSWNTASSAIGKTGIQTLNFSPTTARYVRLDFKVNNKSNYRINELEIYSGAASAAKHEVEVSEVAKSEVIKDYVLEQNYPNPFPLLGRETIDNPSTQIRFGLPQASYVTIKVYTINGAEVRTLVDDRYTAGTHTVAFNAGNLPSGIYFYVMQTGSERQVRRLMLVK